MPKHIPLPPLEQLNELFEIVPIAESQFGIQSGLVWKVNRGTRGRAGNAAGYLRPNSKSKGRFDWKLKINKREYFMSRIVFYMASGIDPGELQVDHLDQNPLNNNVKNLRLGDDSLQGHNKGTKSNNTSGANGVSKHKETNKWVAYLKHKRKQFYLGLYTCKIEAAHAVNNKVIELNLDKIGKPLHDLEALNCNCNACYKI